MIAARMMQLTRAQNERSQLMELPKVILVATDSSAFAEEAVRYTAKLARAVDARVCLVHCWQVPLVVAGSDIGGVFTRDVYAQLEATARSNFDVALEKARADLPGIEGKLVQGDPRDGIVRVAHELKADLIVVATHGRRGLPRLLLGSVAEYVVSHAPCSVLTVRAPQSGT